LDQLLLRAPYRRLNRPGDGWVFVSQFALCSSREGEVNLRVDTCVFCYKKILDSRCFPISNGLGHNKRNNKMASSYFRCDCDISFGGVFICLGTSQSASSPQENNHIGLRQRALGERIAKMKRTFSACSTNVCMSKLIYAITARIFEEGSVQILVTSLSAQRNKIFSSSPSLTHFITGSHMASNGALPTRRGKCGRGHADGV